MPQMSQRDTCRNHRTIHEKWGFCLVLAVVSITASCWPNGLALLRYEHSGLIEGELWRVISAHLVHLNVPHLLLNLSGLLLICELLWGELPLRHGIGLLVFSGLSISAGLYWLLPDIGTYAGLSGVLHGLWAGCAIYGYQLSSNASFKSRLPFLAGAFLLGAKLFLEFLYGPSQVTEQLIGAGVLVSSHLYGALAGMVYVLMLCCVRMRAPTRGALQQQ